MSEGWMGAPIRRPDVAREDTVLTEFDPVRELM